MGRDGDERFIAVSYSCGRAIMMRDDIAFYLFFYSTRAFIRRQPQTPNVIASTICASYAREIRRRLLSAKEAQDCSAGHA